AVGGQGEGVGDANCPRRLLSRARVPGEQPRSDLSYQQVAVGGTGQVRNVVPVLDEDLLQGSRFGVPLGHVARLLENAAGAEQAPAIGGKNDGGDLARVATGNDSRQLFPADVPELDVGRPEEQVAAAGEGAAVW